ncbi:MAG: hypothetical protein IJ550_00835 [Bacteroidaceae bacterium]|nr:hypothetical protein [Bacteroidaceae bacterium]
MPQFSQTEANIIKLFVPTTIIEFEGTKYVIEECAKPRPSSGECKTDIYLKLKSETSTRELKISIKQENADFLENKIKYERAKEILGNDVDTILKKSIESLKSKFQDQYLVLFDKFKRTEANTIKLGWKFEFVNKPGGELSDKLDLSHEQVMDIYSGQNLPSSKRNAQVNGHVINDSGVANYILVIDENGTYTSKQCIDLLQPIETYINQHPDIFFACKALNYRAEKDQWDGNRPLSVYVDWSIVNGKMTGKLNFDNPLKKKGNEIGNNVKKILHKLSISNANFRLLKSKLADDVKYYEIENT